MAAGATGVMAAGTTGATVGAMGAGTTGRISGATGDVMEAVGMSTRPAIETIVIQPTPFCNIECTYCYLPNRRDRSTMSPDTLSAVFERVFESGWVAPAVTVIWHAGEPLVLPSAYYRDAFALIERMRPKDIALRHAFQTNG